MNHAELIRSLEQPSSSDHGYAMDLLQSLPCIDQADVLAGLPVEQGMHLLQQLKRPAEVFSYLPLGVQVRWAQQLSRQESIRLISKMPSDRRVDLVKLLSPEEHAALLPGLAQAERDDIRSLASYGEETAGALMSSDYATLYADMSVAEAVQALRLEAPDAETIYQAYVIDEKRRLQGVVSLRDLILAEPRTPIKELMVRHVISATVDDDQEQVAKLLSRYDLLALPICDHEGRLVGIVTYDDAMDVVHEEATEDIHKGAGVATSIGRFKEASITLLYRKRVFWLVLLVFGNLLSGISIAAFEDIIAANLVLVFFLPLLVGSSGNAGSQSATLMVRALATGDVVMRDWFRLLGREALVALLLGSTMAFAVSILGWYRGGPEVALVLTLSMIVTVLLGCLIGMSLPFILSRFKMDPASASAPLITSLCDAMGVLIYLLIASSILDLTGL